MTQAQLMDLEIIERSGLFDVGWYLERNTDVARGNNDPIAHYVLYGSDEGRNPSSRFTTRDYRALRGADIPPGRNPFAYYIEHGSEDELLNRGLLTNFEAASVRLGIERLARLPFYSDENYLEMNADIGGAEMSLSHHAFVYGFPEGRNVFNGLAIAESLGTVVRNGPRHEISHATTPFATPVRNASFGSSHPSDIAVYYNSLGNDFIREIAADLVSSLEAAGLRSTLRDETSSMDRLASIPIIMAPHEFFHLGRGRDWARDAVVSRCYTYNTEQPQTLWFERSMPFVLMSKGVIDISGQTAAMFAAGGTTALHFTPTIARAPRDQEALLPSDQSHPMVRVLPEQARSASDIRRRLTDRPIDICFFGGSSEHRDAFFVRESKFLADFECYLYYRRFTGPQTNSQRDGVLARLASHVSGHSKISLNIHRDDYSFFEWHRIVKLGMARGSVVVSEPCLPHDLFAPGLHYFEETARHIPHLIEWLLKSQDGREAAQQVQQNALATVYSSSEAVISHERLRNFLGFASERREVA